MATTGLQPRELVLCWGSLPQASLLERIELAEREGFQGISITPPDYVAAREAGIPASEIRTRLGDAGLAVAELDPLLNFVPGAVMGSEITGESRKLWESGERTLLEIAEAIGGRSINCALASDSTIPDEKIAEGFAGVCDRAREHGLLVQLEFLPWTQIPTAERGLEIVELAGRDNGGLMLDTWHLIRGGGTAETVRSLPPTRVTAVQINDAPAEPHPDVIHDTMHLRRLPGDGEIDLTGILTALTENACPAPWGIEVFSAELSALPASEAARRLGDAARKMVGALQA